MSPSISLPHRLGTAASWPAGVAFTSWSYIWRTTPLHRRELAGAPAEDLPPSLPAEVSQDDVQRPGDGAGPLLHRVYTGVILDGIDTAQELMRLIQADPNRVAPTSLARFHKAKGEPGRLSPGDEFVVRMPGPWDGPVRAVMVTPTSFRFATLAGHLEAGQIEWRAQGDARRLVFQIESWARAGDRLSALMHNHLRMAKEVQLHMWSSVVEKVARQTQGRLEAGIDIETRRVEAEAFRH